MSGITLQGILVANLVFFGFTVLLFVGTRFFPGADYQGVPLPDGTRVTYKLNGLSLFVAVLVLFVGGVATGLYSLSYLRHHFWELFIAANVFSFVFSALLYVRGPEKDKGLVKGFWLGTELNPNWWGVDLKVFSYRPSLYGLALFNIAFAFAQYERYGTITLQMWLYQGMTLFYLLSSFQFEHGMLSMFDVIEERFGYMLVWGDYALVPFFYCIPGYFLVEQPQSIPLPLAIGLVALFGFGFWMFRGANSQKNRFKANPEAPIWGRRPETIDGRLLVSGFWGIGRKLNYTGEILVYLSFTIPAGLVSPWAFALPLWLASLLVHRAWRDDKRCRSKYGAMWDKYCARAKFRMLPFIY